MEKKKPKKNWPAKVYRILKRLIKNVGVNKNSMVLTCSKRPPQAHMVCVPRSLEQHKLESRTGS